MKSSTALPVPVSDEPAAAGSVWRAYQNAGGAIDEQELITRHLPLVRNVVARLKLTLPAHIDADDLYSVGITGLLAAVGRYDPGQGQTFAAYATLRIRGAILDELRRLDWCSRRARAKARRLKEAVNEVEQRLRRPATGEEIRLHLGLDPKEYAKWLEEARPVSFVNIDQERDDGETEGASLHELIADPDDVSGLAHMEKDELMELVAQRIAELPDIPRKILAMYYHENLRLAEIAAVFGLTESRICQIHSQTILTLRAYIGRMRER